jgi:PEP-CTERM motif
MKTNNLIVAFALFLFTHSGQSQGSFQYDQQSGTSTSQIEGGTGASVGSQSFVPSLSSVGFFQIYVASLTAGTLNVTVRGNSPSGPILGSSDSLTFVDAFSGVADFIFSAPVSVTSGVTYYFQPVSLSGTWSWGLLSSIYSYPDGTAFFNGVASPNNDFWFREGIVVVPEPSSATLILCGAGFLGWSLRRKRH